MKNSVWLFVLGFVYQQALSQCPSIDFTLDNYSNCCYRVQLNNSSECTPDLRLLLDSGQFTSWTPDAANGFSLTLNSSSELLLTHSSGIIPFGMSIPLEFCVSAGNSSLVTMLYDYICGPGTSCFVDLPLNGCSVQDSCTASFDYMITSCGLFDFENLSTGQSPITYSWNFGDPGSGSSNSSSFQNPSHQFSKLCETYTVCLTITTFDGCMHTVCEDIVVLDIESPILSCPPDILVHCENGTVPSATGFASAVDFCDPNPLITYSDQEVGSFPCDYQIIRTWTAEDKCFHKSICDQIITVKDNIPPVIQCSSDIIVDGENQPGELCVGLAQIEIPVVSDNCGMQVHLINDYNYTNDASDAYPSGTTIVTWTAIDQCGNISTCSFKVIVTECDSATIDSSCCAFTLHFYNEYPDQRIKKVRISGLCETRICCSDPDYWSQTTNYPHYVEFFPADGSGFPLGPGPLDVIDNDIEIWLENNHGLNYFQVDWFDFSDQVVKTHVIEIPCDGDFDEDEDWPSYTSTVGVVDPKLFVFAVREPDDDTESVCDTDELEIRSDCPIAYAITCCGNNYCVSLDSPQGYKMWDWDLSMENASGTTSLPVITNNGNGNATFTVSNDGSQSGRYIIELIAQDTSQKITCNGTVEIIIPRITPDFSYKLIPCGLSIEFTPEINDFSSYVSSISWSAFGESNFPASGTTPFTYTFPSENIYQITMVITDIYGCLHTVQKAVDNSRVCTPNFTTQYTFCPSDCDFQQSKSILVQFNNTSTGGSCPTEYIWDFGDGNTLTTTSSSPVSFTHLYTNVSCPGGSSFQEKLSMNDTQAQPPQSRKCSSGTSIIKTIEISPCYVDFTYIKCPNGSVIFNSTVPGEWDFPGSTGIDEEGSEPKVNGLRKMVKVKYSANGGYGVRFTGHCDNGGLCTIFKEITIEIKCCVRNSRKHDEHRFTENGRKYKLKYKFVQNQYFGNTPAINIHSVKAVTSLKRRNSKIYNFWKNTNDGELTAGFTGDIFTHDQNCSCNVLETINGPNPGPHSGYSKIKTRLTKLGKYHSREDSLISTHTVTVGTHSFTDHLSLGKTCNVFQWWVN